MSSNHVLIIGAGLFQCYMIKQALRMKLEVSVLDRDKNSPGRDLAHHFIQASTKKPHEALKKVITHNKRYPIHGVTTCGTDCSLTVATIATKLNLPGISVKTALAATDKFIMRKTLSDAGLPTPTFFEIETLSQARQLTNKIKFPWVIKPTDNMGARGVVKINNLKDLTREFKLSLKQSIKKRIIVEKFIAGHEVSIDCIVYQGKIYLTTIADRHISGSPYFIERGHTLPSRLAPDIQEKAFNMAKKGIKALGINIGPAKFDMKITRNGPIIGEMAARLSGGFHSQMTEGLSTGKNSIKATLDLCLGRKLNPSDLKAKFQRGACERSIYPKPGTIKSIKFLKEARHKKGIAQIHLNIKVGDIQKNITSNIGKAGHIIGYGNCRITAMKNVLAAKKTIKIETKKR